ncbi:hypothetical protein DY000_02053080 [Brassica cretica]|uniref:Uncharacterized protein n=1 Tax=Brassica cretica TaxID=69181 RepID=A0ABQ7AG95_BRACR|nr:hypothetical protein DY000_02053080 [Brassica cretica]
MGSWEWITFKSFLVIRRENSEVMQRPEGRLGTQRLQLGPERWALNPEVSSFVEHRLLESGDCFHNPEVAGNRRFSFRYWDHDWSPEAVWEPGDSSLDPEIIILYIGPEIVWGTVGFLLRSRACIWARSSLENQEYLFSQGPYYRYLFGFCILQLGSWPLSSSYDVFYFCRKSLTGLEGVGIMTQVPGFAAFHVWISRDYEGGIGGLWRPDPARMPL